jgi:RNA polymerase sigma-70 factor
VHARSECNITCKASISLAQRNWYVALRMVSLREKFLQPLDAATREVEDSEDLEATLERKWNAGRAAHGTVLVLAVEFASAVGARRSKRAFVLQELFAADLYLSVGALKGDSVALRTLEMAHMRPLTLRLGRGRTTQDRVDDAMAQVRESMLVGSAPKLAQYTGQVPLDAWLRVVAERALLTLLRKKNIEIASTDTALDAQAAGDISPEMAALKNTHRELFQTALQASLLALSAEDKQLLIWMVKEQHSIDEIAPRLGVHRATAARMCHRVRARLADAVRDHVNRSLGLTAGSLDSLCAHMSPELNFTLSRLV